jgi:hypothetical protein
MKTYIKTYMTPIGCSMMLAAWTTFGQPVGGAVTVAVPGIGVSVTGGAVAVPDNYVYYPAYGVYYNSSRHQYAYMHGNSWVSGPRPLDVSIDVLQASPSVGMDFHDSPALHHKAMVQKYPKAWKPAASNEGQKPGRQNDRRDERGGK